MILFQYIIEQCIINNYNLVNNLHVHMLILVYLIIVFTNILFNLNLIRVLCYRSTLVRYDLSAFYIILSFLFFYIFYLYFLCSPLSISM